MITTAVSLYEDAKNNKKLTSSERRSVVYYLKATKPEITIEELANTFNVTSKIIQKDVLEIRKRISNEIKNTTVDLVVGDVHDAVKKNLNKLDGNVAYMESKHNIGNDSYTRAVCAALDGWTKYYKTAQEMGIVPKDTTPVTVREYHWVAGVDETGKAYTEQKVIVKEKNLLNETENTTNTDVATII